jgi:hypothetical protein
MGATHKKGIVASFQYFDDFLDSIKAIKGKPEFRGHEIYSPCSYHELMEFAEEQMGPSQVRWFTLVGALTGVTAGFSMCLLLDYDWPIVVGGKTAGVYSLPAYFIFGFEVMILLGALCTIAGMLIMGRLPNPRSWVLHPRITDDRFVVFVPNALPDGDQARLLQELGAEEVYGV